MNIVLSFGGDLYKKVQGRQFLMFGHLHNFKFLQVLIFTYIHSPTTTLFNYTGAFAEFGRTTAVKGRTQVSKL